MLWRPFWAVFQLFSLSSLHKQKDMERKVGGEGGVISVDKFGQLGLHWNSEVMAWAWGRDTHLHYGIERGDDFVEEL